VFAGLISESSTLDKDNYLKPPHGYNPFINAQKTTQSVTSSNPTFLPMRATAFTRGQALETPKPIETHVSQLPLQLQRLA